MRLTVRLPSCSVFKNVFVAQRRCEFRELHARTSWHCACGLCFDCCARIGFQFKNPSSECICETRIACIQARAGTSRGVVPFRASSLRASGALRRFGGIPQPWLPVAATSPWSVLASSSILARLFDPASGFVARAGREGRALVLTWGASANVMAG